MQLVYVDDIVAARDAVQIEWFYDQLSSRFNTKNLGEICKILGIRIIRDSILRLYRFSVATSARLHKSECVFRFYVYGGIFDSPPGLLFACGTDCF
jgi:hypothetical protein